MPFWGKACWDWSPESHKAHQERKLQFLKWMRNDLETRLAGLTAAIETIENQINRVDSEEIQS